MTLCALLNYIQTKHLDEIVKWIDGKKWEAMWERKMPTFVMFFKSLIHQSMCTFCVICLVLFLYFFFCLLFQLADLPTTHKSYTHSLAHPQNTCTHSRLTIVTWDRATTTTTTPAMTINTEWYIYIYIYIDMDIYIHQINTSLLFAK